MPFASCGNCPYPAHGFQCYMTEGDCCVAEIDGDYPILKRLESFDPYELAQFQGAAVSCGYFSMGDLINLTFYVRR